MITNAGCNYSGFDTPCAVVRDLLGTRTELDPPQHDPGSGRLYHYGAEWADVPWWAILGSNQ